MAWMFLEEEKICYQNGIYILNFAFRLKPIVIQNRVGMLKFMQGEKATF